MKEKHKKMNFSNLEKTKKNKTKRNDEQITFQITILQNN